MESFDGFAHPLTLRINVAGEEILAGETYTGETFIGREFRHRLAPVSRQRRGRRLGEPRTFRVPTAYLAQSFLVSLGFWG